MSKNKQSSVEYLIEQVKSKEWQDMFIWHKEETFKKAKEIHKEQTLEFVYDAVRKILDEDRQNPFNLEQFYNETFGDNNEQQ